ncbi:MAG: TadE/TadG family type IV pilus assembly protein [Dehalococcoidia bacterium]|nr:TadE/TadG family type IV pilus assembly protein [Dehalococcoidia bacterium]
MARGESGQALVEAAIVLPVLLVLVFGVVMAGRVVHAKIAVQAAAREAGRALATAPSEDQGLTDADDAARSAADGYGLAADGLTVDLQPNGFERGGTVRATVSYDVGLRGLPLLDALDITVSSSHSEQVDPYRSREAVHR